MCSNDEQANLKIKWACIMCHGSKSQRKNLMFKYTAYSRWKKMFRHLSAGETHLTSDQNEMCAFRVLFKGKNPPRTILSHIIDLFCTEFFGWSIFQVKGVKSLVSFDQLPITSLLSLCLGSAVVLSSVQLFHLLISTQRDKIPKPRLSC